MPFPRKLLNDNEDVILDLRPHWWFLSGPVTAVVLTVALTIFVAAIGAPGLLLVAALALVLVTLVWLLLRFLRWTTTNFVVTTDRLVFRSGVLSKQGREIPLERVNDITFHASLFERVIGAGDLVIESAGERGQQMFTDIPHPMQVQNEVYRQIEAAQQRNADRMAGRRELSVPEQLEKLDELRQRGVISQAEFDTKKSQLLDRM
ncbi:MAG: PH domain-containing protein [Actinobacteria bacterium]|nr:MAG: PH domain-containing protein [Actinomycetota bacterium]